MNVVNLKNKKLKSLKNKLKNQKRKNVTLILFMKGILLKISNFKEIEFFGNKSIIFCKVRKNKLKKIQMMLLKTLIEP